MDRVVGLELAPTTTAKPFEPRELLARIQTSAPRGTGANGARQLRFEGMAIDLDSRTVQRTGHHRSHEHEFEMPRCWQRRRQG